MNARHAILTALAAMLLVGCGPEEQPPRINYYLSGEPDLQRVTRVVLVELSGEEGYPDISRRMTDSLAEMLQSRGAFRVDTVPATHPDLRDLDLDKREPLTLRELKSIQDSLRCDAIVFGRVTCFTPYPRTKMGVYLRLINLRDGELVWAVDNVWDSTDRTMLKRIEHYYFDYLGETHPADSEMVLMSTDKFQKFVCYEIGGTMNPSACQQSKPRSWFENRTIRRIGREQKEFWTNVGEDL